MTKERFSQAMDWHLRLLSEAATEADWLQFEAWLRTAEENRATYDYIEMLAFDVETGRSFGKIRLSDQSSFASLPGARPAANLWATVAVVIFMAACAFYFEYSRSNWLSYETEKGKTQVVRLEDGSVLVLNTASKVQVHFGSRRREVRMVAGEASFDVVKDPDRPFLVNVQDRTIRVVGTEFNVLTDARRLTVTLRRGVLSVFSQSGASGVGLIRLQAGQELLHNRGAPDSSVRTVDPDIAFAWQSGHLVYKDSPLKDIIADLNRYLPVPIYVDEDAAVLRFSGVLTIDDEGPVIGRLEAFLPISIEPSETAIRVHLKK